MHHLRIILPLAYYIMASTAADPKMEQLTYSLVLLIESIPTYELTLCSPHTSVRSVIKKVRQQLLALKDLVFFEDPQCST